MGYDTNQNSTEEPNQVIFWTVEGERGEQGLIWSIVAALDGRMN